MAQEGSSRRIGLWIGGAVLVVGLVALWALPESERSVPPGVPAPETAGVRSPEPGERNDPPPRPVSLREGPLRLESGDVVEIDRRELTGDVPVAIELVLPAGVGAQSGRIVTPGAGELRLDDELAGQSDTVSLALPAAQLREPGRYLLEVRTDERSPLPLRRFAIEVR